MICPLGVKDGFSVVEDYEHLRGGKEGSQESHIVRVFDPRTDDLGEAGEEMKA